MKKILFLFWIIPFNMLAQSQYDVLPYWKYYQAKTPHTYHLLMEKAMDQLKARNARVARIKTSADWQAYRSHLKQQLMKSLGEFPARTPLNVKVVSTVESEGIVAENILFESLPGYYVTASFFKRKDLQGKKLPVIVYCSGHAANGYRSDGYQQIILNYAKKGFAVFAFDPVGQGERIQYRKSDGKPALGPTHDHSFSGSGAFLLGYSPAKYFIWDGIRAIDYLETRPDVDAKRIGIAGRSGGGTQSSYIAAVDDRVVAAAPECYITTYEMLLKSKGPQDAEQVFIHGIANGFDIPDLLHMRAPKPTLVVTTTNDIFSIQGVIEMKEEMTALYKMAGAADNFEVVEDNAGHAPTRLNREACYRFFSRHLQNPCNTEDEAVSIFPEAKLYASNGDVYRIRGAKRLSDLIADNAPRISGKIDKSGLERILDYKATEFTASSIFSGTVISQGYSVDKYLVKAPGGYYLPTVVFRKGDSRVNSGKSVLYFHAGGKTADTTQILKLLDRYDQVVCGDLSGVGELKEYYNWAGDAFIQETPLNLWFLALLTDQSLARYRMQEIDALFAFIKALTPLAAVDGVACGAVTTDLAHWTYLHRDKLNRVILLNPLLSYRSLLGTEEYKTAYLLNTPGGMLSQYDLPDLFNSLGTAKLKLVNPVNANGGPLEAKDSALPEGMITRVNILTDAL